MNRNRRALCGHQGNEPLYKAVPVLADSAPDRAALQGALDQLARVLNSLPSPVDGALADLATRDIATLLNLVPLKKRGDSLRAIGIPVAPRVVGQALCQDVLTKLERVHLHDVRHFAGVVTRPVFADMAARSLQKPSDSGEQTDTRWSDAISRFALWARESVSPETARVLAWSASQPWFLPQTMSQAHGEEVFAAAASVVALTPHDGPAPTRGPPAPRRPKKPNLNPGPRQTSQRSRPPHR